MERSKDAMMIVIAVRGSAHLRRLETERIVLKEDLQPLVGTPLVGLKFHSGFLYAAEQLLPRA